MLMSGFGSTLLTQTEYSFQSVDLASNLLTSTQDHYAHVEFPATSQSMALDVAGSSMCSVDYWLNVLRVNVLGSWVTRRELRQDWNCIRRANSWNWVLRQLRPIECHCLVSLGHE